jgi:hypothetical protein
MFRSYDHFQADIYLPELTLLTTEQFFFFGILDIIVNDYSDQFNVSRLLIAMIAIL